MTTGADPEANRLPALGHTDRAKTSKPKAFILGGTGEVGKALVRELARRDDFEEVCLISRRLYEIPSPEENPGYGKFKQIVIDFDNISDYAEAFSGYQVGFCALGTTAGKSGHAGLFRVDHDYSVGAAELAKAAGCQHFTIVSASGSKLRSMTNYLRIKGLVEDALTRTDFKRLSIFRPALLLCRRVEFRPVESCARCIALVVDCCHFMSIEVPVLAKAIVRNAIHNSEISVEIYENKDIFRMGRR